MISFSVSRVNKTGGRSGSSSSERSAMKISWEMEESLEPISTKRFMSMVSGISCRPNL